jgi:hypothetical protein
MRDQYSHADGSRECWPVVGHGSTLKWTEFRPLYSDRPIDAQALFTAAYSLYMAGRWTCDRPVDAAGLWTALRDALGLDPGTATKAGIGQPPKDVTVTLSVDSEAMRQTLNEVKRLGERVTDLLQANNRAARRRSIESAARALRAALRAYMAERGNEELGKAVGAAAIELDHVLDGAAA